MPSLKILIISGSVRPGSFNSLLADEAARAADRLGGSPTRIDLRDFEMPLYNAEIEAQAIPTAVMALHDRFSSHQGIFIATPEYNAFPSPMLLNTLDWLSRVRHYEGGMIDAFERPVFAISAASPSPIGGYRALTALRQKLALGLGAFVVPAMAAVPAAYQAFDAEGLLALDADRTALDKTVQQLLDRIHG